MQGHFLHSDTTFAGTLFPQWHDKFRDISFLLTPPTQRHYSLPWHHRHRAIFPYSDIMHTWAVFPSDDTTNAGTFFFLPMASPTQGHFYISVTLQTRRYFCFQWHHGQRCPCSSNDTSDAGTSFPSSDTTHPVAFFSFQWLHWLALPPVRDSSRQSGF